MADATSDTSTPATGEDEDAQELLADAAEQEDQVAGDEPDGADQLGDAGKKALQATKEKWKAERDRRRKAEQELAESRKGTASDGDGMDPEKVRTAAEQAATAKANQRIVKAEVRAAAAGKLADPKDALRFIDTEQFEVDDSGDVDTEEIAEAIEDLLRSKPYLAAQGRRFQGTADGGARKSASRPTQLSRDDLKRMSEEQIVQAKAEGRLDDALGIKR